MNQRIREFAEQAGITTNIDTDYFEKDINKWVDYYSQKFAELIVEECLSIVKNREDELESAGLIEESNTVGVVAYRISRQFGVE
jgi:hypothetical protein